jgi:hypothetical protein
LRNEAEDDDDDVTCSALVPVTVPLHSSSWTSLSELGAVGDSYYTSDELEMIDGDSPTDESDLRPTDHRVRNFSIVTTAALPWMTGTAINPLLRAAYLSQMNRPYTHGSSSVTLVLPWLESDQDRVALYGHEWKDKTQVDQERFIRQWLAKSLPLEADINQGGIAISWYAAKYHARYASIFAMGDICSLFGDEKLDVCFLEEPEHLNVYRAPGKRLWTDIFKHVVGVGHTNYVACTLVTVSSWSWARCCNKAAFMLTQLYSFHRQTSKRNHL